MRNDNYIETRRNIWQNAFWGIAGSLDWQIEQLQEHQNATPQVWSIYERVASFFEGVDLNKDNWHSGITKLESDGKLTYQKSYRDDCIRNDELADVVYLRSGDREKAFGVITNRRANYYTLGEGNCSNDTIEPFPPAPPLNTYGSVTPGSGNNRLRLRNMGTILQEFKIKYYSPYDLVNSIKEETRWGPQLTLEFPTMGGTDSLDVILFEVFRMGENFKSMHSDITDSEEIFTREPKEDKGDEVIVYPNPNDGSFVVLIDNSDKVGLIQIVDNLGKVVDRRTAVRKENQYNKNILNSGVYFIEILFEDKIVRKKIIVN